MTNAARADPFVLADRPPLPVHGLIVCLAACAPALAASLALPQTLAALCLCMLAAGGWLLMQLKPDVGRGGLYKPFYLPALLVLMSLSALALAATPLAPGGVHPLWSPVGRGGAVLDFEACLLGALTLAGLSFGALIAARAGADRSAAPRTISLLPIVFVLPEAGLGVRYWADGERTTAALLAVFLGLSLILCAGSVLRALRRSDSQDAFGRLRGTGTAPWIGLMCAVALAFLNLDALVAALAALCVLGGWDFLAAGGTGRLRRGPLLVVLGLGVAVVASGSAFALGRMGLSIAGDVCRRTHLGAVLAAPWLGYGPGSIKAVVSLWMTRENVFALSDPSCPPSAYLAAFEQDGLLVTVPLLLALISLTWSAASGSMRRRTMAAAIRTLVCAVGFCALFAVVDAVPGSLAGLAPALLMLAMAVGASRVSR